MAFSAFSVSYSHARSHFQSTFIPQRKPCAQETRRGFAAFVFMFTAQGREGRPLLVFFSFCSRQLGGCRDPWTPGGRRSPGSNPCTALPPDPLPQLRGLGGHSALSGRFVCGSLGGKTPPPWHPEVLESLSGPTDISAKMQMSHSCLVRAFQSHYPLHLRLPLLFHQD